MTCPSQCLLVPINIARAHTRSWACGGRGVASGRRISSSQLAVEAHAVEIESPFGVDPNHLPIESYVHTVRADVLRTLQELTNSDSSSSEESDDDDDDGGGDRCGGGGSGDRGSSGRHSARSMRVGTQWAHHGPIAARKATQRVHAPRSEDEAHKGPLLAVGADTAAGNDEPDEAHDAAEDAPAVPPHRPIARQVTIAPAASAGVAMTPWAVSQSQPRGAPLL